MPIRTYAHAHTHIHAHAHAHRVVFLSDREADALVQEQHLQQAAGQPLPVARQVWHLSCTRGYDDVWWTSSSSSPSSSWLQLPLAAAQLFNGSTAFPDEARQDALRAHVLATSEAKAVAKRLPELRDLQRFYHASDLEVLCEED
jgi:hypothetical protein